MTDRLAASVRGLADWRLIVTSGVIFVAFASLLFGSVAPFSIGRVRALCGQAPPDVRFFTSAADLQGFMAGCGEAGRLAYRNLQLADLFYPAVTAIFQAAVLAMALTRILQQGSKWFAVAALPLVGAGFDYVENVAAWTALYTFPSVSKTATVLLGIGSPAKQAVSWAAGVLLLLALAYASVHWMIARRRPVA